jgi:micrococcal nuclease
VHLARLLSAVLLASACGAAQAERFVAVVTHVTDGDTLWVREEGRDRKPVKLRLQGIDAPERCQAGGAEATAALTARVLHQRVEVDARATDDYQRRLVVLRQGGEDVGAWMVEQGHAWSYRHRRARGPYAAEEAEARHARRGLFADPQALEPRVFRKRHGPCD